MTKHVPIVAGIPPRYYPYCRTCGWTGKEVATKERARMAARYHRNEPEASADTVAAWVQAELDERHKR